MNEEKKGMFLESASGFMMPFACTEGTEVVATLLYGDQVHPLTGTKFFHTGLDLVADHVALYACATGVVVAIGNDTSHGNFIVCRYGKYDVKYGHITETYCNYGTSVRAGQKIAVSGDFLHLGVNFNGKEIDPKDFVFMLVSNIMELETMGIKVNPDEPALGAGVNIKTDYDKDQPEIFSLMMKYLPLYFTSLDNGQYTVPSRTDQILRNIFSQSAEKNYFFERMPDLSNPLGLSDRALPLASKVANVLIGDFLNYLAVCHHKYLSTWDDVQKKKWQLMQNRMK